MKDKNGKEITVGTVVLVKGRVALVLELAEGITVGTPEGPKTADLVQLAMQGNARIDGPGFITEVAGIVKARNWIYTEVKETTADMIESVPTAEDFGVLESYANKLADDLRKAREEILALKTPPPAAGPEPTALQTS